MIININYFYRRMNWGVYSVVVVSLLCYFWWNMYDNYGKGINFYDVLITSSEVLTYSYAIIPSYLVIITSTISFRKNHLFFLFRFKSRLDYFIHILTQLVLSTTTFILIVILTIFASSLFTLSFKNEWSFYAVNYYAVHEPFLTQHSPLLYAAITFLLLWCCLFVLGLLFFTILLLTQNAVVAIFFILLVDLLNVGVAIGQIDALYPYVFINYLDMFLFIYAYDLSKTAIPLQIFLYWFILVSLLYIVCRFVVKHVDLNEKGVNKE